MKDKQCGICKGEITQIFSLGEIPIVNYFLSRDDLSQYENKYTLDFCICSSCSLGQISEKISPKKLFSTYHYSSSTSLPLKKHLEKLADSCTERFKLGERSFVIDVGCNDGTLLTAFQKNGMQTLGIDPAKNITKKAEENGIQILSDFFTTELAEKLIQTYKQPTVIFAINTLAQSTNLDDFVKGIATLLAKDGTFVVEVGYLVDMVQKNTFDSIYHEHVFYFSLTSLVELFSRYSLEIYDAERITNHGGSLRIFVKHAMNKKITSSKRIKILLEDEKKLQLQKLDTYIPFSRNIKEFRKEFRSLLLQLKRKQKKIIGVGAPAKSVVLLNYCGVDKAIIDYIIDSTSFKQYRFMPGVRIPIYPEEYLAGDTLPDYFLLLAWTYKETLLNKLSKYRSKGAKIIIPFPQIHVI